MAYASTSVHPQAATGAPPIAVPEDGATYYGVQLAWGTDTPAQYTGRLGRAPMVYGDYVSFPLDNAAKARISADVDQAKGTHAKLLLALMPNEGLNTVTEATARDLGIALVDYNARGVEIFIRFAHEMNGSWYAWSQQPARYVIAYRIVASAVHRYAPKSAMVWAPNYGGGYPFNTGTYNAKPGTADFVALDTNHDGVLTMDDDPYEPYFPGDAYVDWVGLTNYHWGNHLPWGRNELPEPGQFAKQITGTYDGLLGDQRGVPDFYATYAVNHNKPLALAETSALYNPDRIDGASNYDIKMEWARQVFDPGIAAQFPRLKMLLWFEYIKQEEFGTGTVDWRVTYDTAILAGFQSVLPSRLIFASWQPTDPPLRRGEPW